ncbi:hypothetical protein P43SY_005429 [Pythium insidiosum]|uniref:Uncharacterized protein n=1 Tax=Pythium insidiosum TaxID=114742 RepID=A0AAD5Q657_PYTIN|nr:hypothetical protein P43SY_005429 [Pythium insidiosum]
MSHNNSGKGLYPAELHERATAPRSMDDTSQDERMARQLQAQFDRERFPDMVVAQPTVPGEMPFNCGHCGTTHVVRNVSHGAMFACTRCGRQNRIQMGASQPVVVV